MHVREPFSPLSENRGGLKAKLKTHGTFHLKRQPGWREGQGSERVGVFSNTWSVSGNCRVIAVAVGRGVYGRICVLKCETGPRLRSWLLLAFFVVIPSSYENILFTILISQTQDGALFASFASETAGQTKAIRKQ